MMPIARETCNALNKLARTYRSGGEQKITVHHVSVNDGGQAIVGNVNQAPSGTAPGKARP